jgi:hypothetical protein
VNPKIAATNNVVEKSRILLLVTFTVLYVATRVLTAEKWIPKVKRQLEDNDLNIYEVFRELRVPVEVREIIKDRLNEEKMII